MVKFGITARVSVGAVPKNGTSLAVGHKRVCAYTWKASLTLYFVLTKLLNPETPHIRMFVELW